MRIDDENKVVWCSEWLIDRLEKSYFDRKNSLGKIKILSTFTLSDHVPDSCEEAKWKRITNAIFSKYSFKLEQPQKYYWRKKKEYLSWVEFGEFYYLTRSDDNEYSLEFRIHEDGIAHLLTESEARDILKDDFDKFEKVECE